MSSDGAKLVRAAAAGNDAKVKRLLKAKADVDAVVRDEEGLTGVTALQEASWYGHMGAVQLLLKAKATVDLCDAMGMSALYGTTQNGHLSCARLLLDAKATVDLPNKNQR